MENKSLCRFRETLLSSISSPEDLAKPRAPSSLRRVCLLSGSHCGIGAGLGGLCVCGGGGCRCRSEEAGLGPSAVKDSSSSGSNVSEALPGSNVPQFINNSSSTEIIFQILF